jgi:hypothetical protein
MELDSLFSQLEWWLDRESDGTFVQLMKWRRGKEAVNQ